MFFLYRTQQLTIVYLKVTLETYPQDVLRMKGGKCVLRDQNERTTYGKKFWKKNKGSENKVCLFHTKSEMEVEF